MNLPYKVKKLADTQKNFEWIGRKLGILRVAGSANGPTFGVNWANYGGAYGGLAVWKVGPIVVLRGLIFKNAAVVGGETMATVPNDCVPDTRHIFTAAYNGGVVRFDVDTNGAVINQGGPGFGGAVGAVPGGAFYHSICCVFITTKP